MRSYLHLHLTLRETYCLLKVLSRLVDLDSAVAKFIWHIREKFPAMKISAMKIEKRFLVKKNEIYSITYLFISKYEINIWQ